MSKAINISLTETQIAAIVSALDFVLIKNTCEQFTDDRELLDAVYETLDADFPGNDGDDNGLHDFTKALAANLAAHIAKEAA